MYYSFRGVTVHLRTVVGIRDASFFSSLANAWNTHITHALPIYAISYFMCMHYTFARVRAHVCLPGYFSIVHFRYGHTVIIFPIAVRITQSNTSNCAVGCTHFCTRCVAYIIIVLIFSHLPPIIPIFFNRFDATYPR